MSISMLEHTKVVLKEVSFDETLFCKELEKASRFLLPYELDELMNWISDSFDNDQYKFHCVLDLEI